MVNDLLMAVDSDSSTVLLLLDLSAAFDTVDHKIFLKPLENDFGVRGSPLAWLHSCLLNRTQSVIFNNLISNSVEVKFGVPQGSVLGPLLFSIYMAPLGDLTQKYGINFHFYADDTQLYIAINPDYSSQLSNLENYLAEIKTWLSVNFLLLNADKTELLIIKSSKHKHIFENLTITLDGCKISQSPTDKNLGVIFDPSLSFQTHIKAIIKTAFFHFCNISKIRP